ncbi:hypothetical protein L1987_17669 [Smallanthus sonchifolius]|uniref:Uncharacterized protein n=1 Tax=Smallanthus sonchifolius TaxID=185202 RepID=A0ACB9IZS8_9ASTR|nr:hypothetical protein L1987_17669 [Smallanthus sonchifolius]
MFKSTRWKSDKNKIKIVFKLQFHATQGSSIFGVVGEVSLDFSCYAEATKPSSVSLPLKNAKSTSVLHVSVQRVQDQREVDVSENVNEDDKNLKAKFSNGDIKGSIQSDPSDDHRALSDNINRGHGTSSGSDITLSGSDSSSGLDTPREPVSKNTKLAHETSTTPIYEEQHQRSSSQWDWLDGSVHDLSTDDSSMISPRETLLTETSEEGPPDVVIKKLKGELLILARQAEVSEMELQTLRKQVMKESKKGLDLSKEVAALKEERNELKEECEKMKAKVKVNGNLLTKGGDPWAVVDELKQELNYEKDLNSNLSQLQEQLKMQYECSTSYTTVNELESQIESLNNELKLKSKELSESVLAIKELETHIKNLEEDLDNQAHGFEADMEDLIRAKIEQEQRAIRAEENLRKVKLQNSSTAVKLQEEFRKLSTEMASAFQESENAAMKAIDEANQLRVEKMCLEEMVKKVKEEFDFLWGQHEDKLVDLSNQITLKSKHLEEVEQHIENLSHELKHQKTSYNAKIKNLDDERNYLENEICFVKLELESSKKELRNVINDKDNEVERLLSETERLKSRCNDMKQFLKENELEKESLKKQVSQLKGDLKKKDEAICRIEKNLKEGSKPTPRNNKTVPDSQSPKEFNNMDRIKLLEGQIKLKETALECSEASFLEKEIELKHKIEELERRLEVLDQNIKIPQTNYPTLHFNYKIVKTHWTLETDVLSHCCSDDAIKPETKKTGDQEIFEVSSNEMELLNKNKSMEIELKEMQERYSEISLKFAEVEGERQQLVMTLRNLKNTKKC